MDAYAQLRYNQQLNAGNPSNLIKRKRLLNKYQYKKYYNLLQFNEKTQKSGLYQGYLFKSKEVYIKLNPFFNIRVW